MEKNKKEISTCHSELASESMSLRGVLTPWQSRRAAYGRSMVEMLGVLAIIGVLSIGALAGYRAAITRHKANSILADVSLGLADLKTQDRATKDTFDNFNFRTESGYAITGKQSASGYAYVKVENVEEAVCEKLLTFKNTGNYGEIYSDDNGTNALNECTADALTTMVFAEKNTVAGGDDNQGGSTVDPEDLPNPDIVMDPDKEGECTCSNWNCSGASDGQECTEGYTCFRASSEYVSGTGWTYQGECRKGCTKNSECGTGYYCAFENSIDCYDEDKGTCQKIGDSYTIDGEPWLMSKNDMTWWSAKNWCLANGKHMIADWTALNCPATFSESEWYDYYACQYSDIVEYKFSYGPPDDAIPNAERLFGKAGGAWTSNEVWTEKLTSDSCAAYGVDFSNSRVGTVNIEFADCSALCR